MKKFIFKTMLMALCLAFIPSLRGSAINLSGLVKAVEAITKKSGAKESEAAAKLMEKLEKNNPNKLQQAARGTGSNGLGYAGARAGQIATRPVQCSNCHGIGVFVNAQGQRMACCLCGGRGYRMQISNAMSPSVEKPSEPFWKKTWFLVACGSVLLLGGGYCWSKAS